MKRILLLLFCLAQLALLPAAASAQIPDPALKLTATPGALPGHSLTLKASCAKSCRLRLRELNVLRFDRAGVQQAGSITSPLKGSKRLPAGKAVTIRLPLSGETGTFARHLVKQGEYARVSVIADYSGPQGARQVQRSVAMHKSGMKKLAFADDDLSLNRPRPPKGKVARYRVTASAVQRTTWSYNRDAPRGDRCTMIANGRGTQVLRFKPTESVVAKLAHHASGKPYFATSPSSSGTLYVGGKLAVDRKGVRNAGLVGDCDGDYGGGGGEIPAPLACNGKVEFPATVMVSYDQAGRLSGYRLATESIMGLDRGVDCPVEMGSRNDSELGMMWAMHPKADPTRDGDPGKYIALVRGSLAESIPGGKVKTNVTYTITFRKLR